MSLNKTVKMQIEEFNRRLVENGIDLTINEYKKELNERFFHINTDYIEIDTTEEHWNTKLTDDQIDYLLLTEKCIKYYNDYEVMKLMRQFQENNKRI